MRKTAIQVGPSRYKIKKHKWGAKRLADSRGYHSNYNDIGLEIGMPKDMEAEVFMHEVLHAIWFTFNFNKAVDDEYEEFVVTEMSTALCTVMTQNPWFLDYLKKAFNP